MIDVSILTNDERGNDTGRISAIHLDDALELNWGEIGSAPSYRLVARKFFFLQRHRYDVHGIREWYGNWCWTGIGLSAEDTARLLNACSKDDRWHVEGGWCDLSDAFVEGKVTPELLAELETS